MLHSRVSPQLDLNALRLAVNAGWKIGRDVPGFLSEREARFLMNAIALSPAQGENVEIGSFLGRSTVCLAYVAHLFGCGSITAIDPHTAPAETDPSLNGGATSYDQFIDNITRAGVHDSVQVERAFSHHVAAKWSQPIRFLWIDGDHTYAGAKADVDLFKPFLADGAIIAMHDVLGTFEGSLRVFVEEVLRCDDFGAAGFSGSIGWAQFRPRQGNSFAHRTRRALLALPASRLIPVARRGRELHGIDKYIYKFWRPLAPHGDVDPAQFSRRLTQ